MVFKRATALLALDRGKSFGAVAQTVGGVTKVFLRGVQDTKKRGLSLLWDAVRSGRPVQIDGEQRVKITALACSTPPEGYARWSLRLLAGKAVELGYVEHLSHHEAGKILRKMN
jgi:putative transposase